MVRIGKYNFKRLRAAWAVPFCTNFDEFSVTTGSGGAAAASSGGVGREVADWDWRAELVLD